MNATQAGLHDLSYSDKAPVLIGATSDAAMARAVRTIELAGHRIGERMTLASARERIERQAVASALWFELDRDGGPEMDQILDSIIRHAAEGRFCAVVSSTADLIDPVVARIDDPAVELIVDANRWAAKFGNEDEFLPRYAKLEAATSLPGGPRPEGAGLEISVERARTKDVTFEVTSPAGQGLAVIPWHAFPGWQVSLDGLVSQPLRGGALRHHHQTRVVPRANRLGDLEQELRVVLHPERSRVQEVGRRLEPVSP